MSDALAKALLDAGLIETGYFQQGDKVIPFRLRLEMLPSYPDVLSMIVTQAQALIAAMTIDRLVCSLDAVPFGTALSLQTGLPLVYSRGRGESAVFDLVGAYDVGHPACLLVNTLDDASIVTEISRRARSVGLNIRYLIAIIDLETVTPPDDIAGQSLLTLSNLAESLQNSGLMTPLQGQALRDWQIEQQA